MVVDFRLTTYKMKDLFFTILTIWIMWRIYESFRVSRFSKSENHDSRREGEVTVEYKSPKKNSKDDQGGEYIDYEEMK